MTNKIALSMNFKECNCGIRPEKSTELHVKMFCSFWLITTRKKCGGGHGNLSARQTQKAVIYHTEHQPVLLTLLYTLIWLRTGKSAGSKCIGSKEKIGTRLLNI